MTNLDWQEIAQKFPLSYQELVGYDADSQQWVCDHSTRQPLYDALDNDEAWHDYNLYQLFENYGLVLTIQYIRPEYRQFGTYIPQINNLNSGINPGLAEYLTRQDAEWAGWEYCFEALESQLREENE